MRKLLLISMVVVFVFASAVTATAGPAGPPYGFILQDTDAAYVDFTYDEDCNVSVGYVRTDRLKFFGQSGGFNPHSDLQVILTGGCGPAEGTVDTLFNSNAGILELTSASVVAIEVPLDDGRIAIVDLEWTADGDIINWMVTAPGMHAKHETRLADIAGTVTITDGVAPLWTVDETNVLLGEGELDAPRITHYDEIDLRP